MLDLLFLQRSKENQCSLRPLGSEERAPLSNGSKQFEEWTEKPETLIHLPHFPQFVGQVHQRIGKAGQGQILKIQQDNVYKCLLFECMYISVNKMCQLVKESKICSSSYP